MQQQYNNQYQPQQPQGQPRYQPQPQPQAPQQQYQPQPQPQYQQAPQQPQYQPQPQYQQPYQQPVYKAPKQPMAKDKLFGLLTTILFGAAALFALIAMIGFCVKLSAHAGMIVSYVISIFACVGIALAPFFKKFTKLCITASSAALFLGMYGISMIGLAGSFGYFILMLGFACLAALCWLSYTNNNLVKTLWFVPAPVIFLGAMLNWIIEKYFTMMKWAVAFYLFDLLFAVVAVGAAVILGLYLKELHGVQSVKISIPNPAPRAPQQPQQPQGQPQYPPQQPPQA